MKALYFTATAAAAFIASSSAQAAPIVTVVNANLLTTPTTFSYQGASFSFSATDSLFTPLTVQTNSTGALSAFGGFLGIALVPTTSFTNRGTVTYGPGSGQFASFLDPIKPNATNGENFIGLRASVGGESYYGYAFTTGNVLNSFAFESIANTAITATAAVPEPATWALMLVGFAMVGGAARYRRRSTYATYA